MATFITFGGSGSGPLSATDLYTQDKSTASYGSYFFTDFFQDVQTTGSDNGVKLILSGGNGSISTGNALTNRTGILGLSSGTSGYAAYGVSADIDLGGGTWYCETGFLPSALSTGSNRFRIQFGFYNVGSTSTAPTNGVFFLYDEGGLTTGSAASANWQTVTCASSSRTYTTTSTAVQTSTYVRLGFEITNTSNVNFYINGTLVSTHTTNIPTNVVNHGGGIYWAVGAQRNAFFDYHLVTSVWNTPR